jgi:hypothetical protein
MELFYFLPQRKTPSPAKVTTVTSLAKKTYNDSFTKMTCQIHLTIIPFLTAMKVKEACNEAMSNAGAIRLQPLVALVNQNTLTSAKAIQIVHTLMGNFCHGDPEKVSQLEDMGNNVCLVMGYHNKVSSTMLVQIIICRNNLLTLLLIIRLQLWMMKLPLI